MTNIVCKRWEINYVTVWLSSLGCVSTGSHLLISLIKYKYKTKIYYMTSSNDKYQVLII